MSKAPFGLLELGSNSLKVYRVEAQGRGKYTIETRKIPWRVAHDYFSHGDILEDSIHEVLLAIRRAKPINPDIPLDSMLCVATGVFREFPAIAKLGPPMRTELGVRLRVITGEDEAKLMARSFHATAPGPVLLCDLGGATTEWAWVESGRLRDCGSLRLGAIRNHYVALSSEAPYERASADYCDRQLVALPTTAPCALVVTGGTVKALSEHLGQIRITLNTLREAMRSAERHGPPDSVRPQRREVFLSGLITLERLAVHCQADRLEYGRTSVRDGMAARLTQLLRKHRPDDLHSTLLLYTTDGG